MVNSKHGTFKKKYVVYIKVFVEFYNKKNFGQVSEIHKRIELKKICVLIIKNSRNLDAYEIIEILLVIYNAHKISRN